MAASNSASGSGPSGDPMSGVMLVCAKESDEDYQVYSVANSKASGIASSIGTSNGDCGADSEKTYCFYKSIVGCTPPATKTEITHNRTTGNFPLDFSTSFAVLPGMQDGYADTDIGDGTTKIQNPQSETVTLAGYLGLSGRIAGALPSSVAGKYLGGSFWNLLPNQMQSNLQGIFSHATYNIPSGPSTVIQNRADGEKEFMQFAGLQLKQAILDNCMQTRSDVTRTTDPSLLRGASWIWTNDACPTKTTLLNTKFSGIARFDFYKNSKLC